MIKAHTKPRKDSCAMHLQNDSVIEHPDEPKCRRALGLDDATSLQIPGVPVNERTKQSVDEPLELALIWLFDQGAMFLSRRQNFSSPGSRDLVTDRIIARHKSVRSQHPPAAR